MSPNDDSQMHRDDLSGFDLRSGGDSSDTVWGFSPPGTTPRLVGENGVPHQATAFKKGKMDDLSTDTEDDATRRTGIDTELSSLFYLQAFEASPDGIIVSDESGIIREVNPRVEAMFGYDAGELLDQLVDCLVPQESRGGHAAYRHGYVESPTVRGMGVGRELWGRRKDGSVFPVEISLSPMSLGDNTWVISTVRDLTEQRRRQEFHSATLRAMEDERRRIARDLHDDTAQLLAAMLLRLRVTARTGDAEHWRSEISNLRQSISEVAEGVRGIARGLRPPALEDAGLVAAIQSLVHTVLDPTPIDSALDLDPTCEELSQEEKLVLYRVVQESISNALKHASPTKIHVSIRKRKNSIATEIRDDGTGFSPMQQDFARPGLGLIGMRERATLVQGQLDVESTLSEGTVIRLTIPLQSD